MRARQFILVEYDRSKTEASYGKKILSTALKDNTIPREAYQIKNGDENAIVDMVMSRLEDSDPTAHKEYVQALAKLYTNGGVKFEDLGSTVADYLLKFHKLKQKKKIPSPRNDFMGYAHIGDFYNVVDEYPNPDAPNVVDKGKARKYYEDGILRIIIPDDEAAARYYGQGTRWCTAARTNNMFMRYWSVGPLYIILPKSPRYPGEKYQFHFESKSFMDERDEPDSLKDMVLEYPSLRRAFVDQAMTYSLVDLMEPEVAKQAVAKAKIKLEAESKIQPDNIVTINLFTKQNGIDQSRCDAVHVASGKDLYSEDYDGPVDTGWAIINTRTGEVALVLADWDEQGTLVVDNFRGESEGVDYLTKETLSVCQRLVDMLSHYMDFNSSGDVRDEARAYTSLINAFGPPSP